MNKLDLDEEKINKFKDDLRESASMQHREGTVGVMVVCDVTWSL